MYKLLLTCLFSYIVTYFLFAQNPADFSQSNTILYEKLYLHTDREIYSGGDDIWFKSYLVSGINHKPIAGYKNVYVQLISEDREIIDSCLVLSVNGFASNDLKLPDSLKNGTYLIRAYTKYLLNFGEVSVFHKKIAVASSTDLSDFEIKQEATKLIDVSFLPEGGSLVTNAANRVAFKAVNGKGKGTNITGRITDETGNEIVKFESRCKGMGTFIMMPQEGKKYFAKIDSFPDFSYQFGDARIDGVAIQYQSVSDNLRFTLNRNIKLDGVRKIILQASSRGKELFREEFEMDGFQHQIEIYKGFFPLGISKITVYDEHDNILAERLIFVRNEGENTLEIIPDKLTYGLRDKVELEIKPQMDYAEDTFETGLSVAVVNDNYFSQDGNNQTIESYLLLDSELKGPVESPASYFKDEENITSDEKLDLVMLVHGWRRYYWDELEKQDWSVRRNWDDTGLTIKGRIQKLFGDKPVKDAIVKMGPFSNLFTILRDTTDAEGRFRFERVYLGDSSSVMINATTKNGSHRLTVINETQPVFNSVVSGLKMNQLARDVSIPPKFYSTNYYRSLAEREFELEEGSILLNDIDILGEKKEKDQHFRIYGTPDNSLQVTEDDWTYIDILDYLQSNMVAGVVVTDESISIRGSSDIHLLVDGIPPYIPEGMTAIDVIKEIPIQDVDKIEILKSGFSSAVFGSSGGGTGILSILTRTGDGAFENEFKRIIHGRITPEFTGFKQAREFYSPKYPLHELDEMNRRKPDFRPTMYWNPNVFIENEKVSLGFYTSEMAGKYTVIVEGISKNGKICFETILINVESTGN